MNPKFDELYKLYEEYNSHTNISAIRDKNAVYEKHFKDSLLILENCKLEGKIIDIGTGGGFPALPLAIERPELDITAIDSVGKKIKFVNLAKEKLGLEKLTALTARAEELAHNPEYREKFDIGLSRAVAELRILLELASGFIKPGGKFIAYKKSDNAGEFNAAKKAAKESKFKLIEQISYAEDKQLLIFEKTGHCHEKLPRSFQQIKKNPF